MLGVYDDVRGWYDSLDGSEQLRLWQLFSVCLNNRELTWCMSEVRRGRDDLFEIHYKNGYLEKYQIYFHQIMRRINESGGDDGRNS